MKQDDKTKELNDFRLNGAQEMPMDLFNRALDECAEEARVTNEGVLEDFFVNIETTHIMSMNVVPKEIENRPTLLIMAGPNGSGKTTIMTHLAKHGWLKGMVYQNQDFIAQNLYGGWNDDSAIRKSAAYCEEEREACLREMKSIAFETVSGLNKLDYIKRAKAAGYHVIYIYISTYSPTVQASRVAIRVMKGGHSIPLKTIISRYMESLLNSRALVRVADVSYIYDNSAHNTPPKLLMTFRNGELSEQHVNPLPRWAQSILEY